MIRLLSRHHPAANSSPPLPLCPAAGQRRRGGERGGEGLAEAQLPHVFQDGISPFAPGQSHSGRRPRCGVPVAVGRAADWPVRYITLADNASTVHNKTKRKTAMRKLCDKDGGENNIKNEVA